jgi:hypothetical protein
MELLNIVQILYSPVIKIETVNILKRKIQPHLNAFKALFPITNITPKQHNMIHLPTMITRVGPLIRSSCFAFEKLFQKARSKT